MIAAGDLKNAASVRERSFLDVLYPSAIDAERNMIFGFAGNGAGVAADALAVIDDESVSHGEDRLRSASKQQSGLGIVADERTPNSDGVEAGSSLYIFLTPCIALTTVKTAR